MVITEKIKARLRVLFPKANLSKKRIDDISAKLSKKLDEESTEEQIDELLTDYNEIAPMSFEELAKQDDKIRTLATKAPNKRDAGNDDENGDEYPEEPAYFKKWRMEQEKKFAQIEASQRANTRESLISKTLKGVEKEKVEKVLKNFKRMNFENDDEFNEFVDELSQDYKADIDKAKLDGYGNDTPHAGSSGGRKKTKTEVKQMSAEEAKNLVGKF